MLNGKTILITGGTGSFGKAFCKVVLLKYPEIKKLIIFSRDELKQFDMSNDPLFKEYAEKMRFFIGDVRDAQRLARACENVDIIVHAAALKQVPTAEYNPMECIQTNIIGAQNVIHAALDCGASKVVALSTDKAAAPVNLYGATKLCSDKLFIAANNMKGNRNLDFSVVRYGNVMGSRGSVIPYFLSLKNSGELPITHAEMTRFNITLEQGVDMVLYAIENAWGGEIFVPKIPSYKITEVAAAIAPKAHPKIVGIRPGEKIHEEMITESDALNTLDCGKYYVITPSHPNWDKEAYVKKFKAKTVEKSFKYNSGTNNDWMTVNQIREQIKLHVDENFQA